MRVPERLLRVKSEIALSGRTLREVACAIGYSPGVLSHVVSGHAAAWPELRRRLAGELDVPESELFPSAESVR